MAVSRRRWNGSWVLLLLAGLVWGGRAWWTDADIAARWRRSSRRSRPAGSGSPSGTWRRSWPGNRIPTGPWSTSWDAANRRGGETRRPAKPGAGRARFRVLGPGDLGPHAPRARHRATRRRRTARSSTRPKIRAMTGRPCSPARADLQPAGPHRRSGTARRGPLGTPESNGGRGVGARHQAGPAAHRTDLEAHPGGGPSVPISTRPPAWLPRTIGSGWVERTWRSGPAPMTRPSAGSMPA